MILIRLAKNAGSGLAAAAIAGVFAFAAYSQAVKSQEVSDSDGVPVILKHLPDWEQHRDSAVFIGDRGSMAKALGERPVLGSVEFDGGTEAAMADYPAGKLLIIEYSTPQAATEADAGFLRTQGAGVDPGTLYRRVGNYAVFVFDAVDPAAAAGLIDRVRYEKEVKWLGEDPFLLQKFERYFALTAGDVVVSIVIWILIGVCVALVLGTAAGFMYFRYRERERKNRTAFSDAGGMVRLNLDGFSEPIRSK